ncbi:MAG: hypothetical protein Q7R67_02430 [bacterium]|nr:hypothetical protein [bacterium]
MAQPQDLSNISYKPEKIASALYLITGFFTDAEPIKWKLRALAADLVSLGLSLRGQMFKEREAARLEVRVILLEVMGLLNVTKNVGLVSDTNHNLLNQELLKYLDLLGFPEGLREENGFAILSPNFFGTETRELKSREVSDIFPIKDKIIPEYKGHTNFTPREEKREKPLREFGAVSVKKNSRQSVIISLLKRKKEIMIKDVSPLISDCSEKTIQRELLAMVAAGILRKTGEKRWSRYSLA